MRGTMRIVTPRLIHLTTAVALGALLIAGAAGAASSVSFSDPAGDAGPAGDAAPDITNVSVTFDDSGTLTFRVTLANRPNGLDDLFDTVGVALDLDQNPDTGSVLYGAEVGMFFDGTSPEFQRPDKQNRWLTQVAPPPSFLAGFSNGVATFSVKASDLGLSPKGGFNIVAEADNLDWVDTAPDIRTANFQLVPGTAPPTLGPDTRPPYVDAYTAHAKRGGVARLYVDSADGRGATADTFRVYRGKHVIAVIPYDLADKNPFYSYYAAWHVPRHIKGPLKFCASATDAAGNHSNVACARIVLS